ncbi:hypothetical protein H5123_03970 [Shewanella sp. SR43-4]|uniref:hypothetical protein n=1 Tax=Shewanella sp. SR43-4 TaxID=2760942 RepID=UPI0015FB5B04|nr:hypothetical protein [Shewanella sp. SR43-4]MBB1316797.1 hypothetical protein [Shewanella sp. SR43-4]
MTNNNFQKAIQSGNVYDFFRGKGSYFISSPDYDGHVHGAQMGGAARVYAEESREHSKEFDKFFLEFLDSLEVSEDDLNHLLANLSSYCAQKSRGGFTYSFLFENQNGPEWDSVNRYLNEVSKSSFFGNVKSQIARHANFINKKGYKFLSYIFETL